MILTIAWWVILLGGLIPTGWFLIRYRPSQWRQPPAVIMRGLVGIVFLLYLRPVGSLVLAGGAPVFRGGWSQISWSFALGLAADLFLLYLLKVFLRYRRAYAAEMRRPPEGDE